MKYISSYRLLLLVTLLGSILASFSYAEVMATPQPALEKGLKLYETGQYGKAISILEETVVAEPDNAVCHHALAKSYGREAERSNWFKAIRYAKKTLAHLKMAVQLEPDNILYLNDLMDYYLEAPEFLGGDAKKAQGVESKIQALNKKLQRRELQNYDK